MASSSGAKSNRQTDLITGTLGCSKIGGAGPPPPSELAGSGKSVCFLHFGTPSYPRLDTNDPGFVRFRSRSDSTKIVMKKY